MRPPRRRKKKSPLGRPITPCSLGETLCTVRVLTEAEYVALPPEERPAKAEYYPGLGWVVPVLGDGR